MYRFAFIRHEADHVSIQPCEWVGSLAQLRRWLSRVLWASTGRSALELYVVARSATPGRKEYVAVGSVLPGADDDTLDAFAEQAWGAALLDGLPFAETRSPA